MSDIIITVFSARRRRQIEQRDSALVLIGEERDRDVRCIAEFADRNRIPYSAFELGSAEANALAATCSLAPDRAAVIFGRNTIVDDPTPDKVARLLGLNLDLVDDEDFDVLIVGGGPAGVAAGVYAEWSVPPPIPTGCRIWSSWTTRATCLPAQRLAQARLSRPRCRAFLRWEMCVADQ
ncbi:MAG: hypothetical protein ABI767_03355 [Rhodanobacter sp.]